MTDNSIQEGLIMKALLGAIPESAHCGNIASSILKLFIFFVRESANPKSAQDILMGASFILKNTAENIKIEGDK